MGNMKSRRRLKTGMNDDLKELGIVWGDEEEGGR